ncbi:hypothetical protein CYY_006452 [Polysphondylium violaceum]|uniref:WD repeat protein mio zinc-ribbon like domain-containing protein n=1 Tax=Polysphondylium violaceum TaxID=133409 RepID=A0A8J4PTF6_9MYCE|nr:hypothetical protein CYY_006452 [Polysphondylium violaceum]
MSTVQNSTSRKRIIQWSPHDTNSFIVGSNDIRLYNIKYTDSFDNGIYHHSHHHHSSTNRQQYINEDSAVALDQYSNSVSSPSSPYLINNKLSHHNSTGSIANVGKNFNNNNNSNNRFSLPQQNHHNHQHGNSNSHSHHNSSNKDQSNNTGAFSYDIEYPQDGWEPKDKKSISLISVNSEVQLMKCMSWSPDQSDPNLVACGLTNGRAILTSFSSVNRILKEFAPRHIRACNTLAWNPIFKHQIAVGLDKVRGDMSTLVWDINYINSFKQQQQQHHQQSIKGGLVDAPHTISQISDNSFSTITNDYTETIYQPLSEFTLSEATLSLAWLPNSPHCLMVGTGSKWLKIYDIRDTNTSQALTTHQKSVSGLCFDPFDSNRFATMGEDSLVRIWDLRKFDESILTINTNCKSLQQIEWCPTRSGVLATVGKDKNTIKLWDIKSPIDLSKSPKPDRKQSISNYDPNTITKPTKTHHSTEIIASFSWHPTNECRMLTVSYSGVIEVVSMNENIPISWSPHGNLSFSHGNHLLEGPSKGTTIEPDLNIYKNLKNEDGRYDRDISLKMKERAKFGYSANVEENVNLGTKINDEGINFLWNWISKTPGQIRTHKKKMLINEETQKDKNDFVGIHHILFDSDNYFLNPSVENVCGFLHYKSHNRFLCSSICGWGVSPSLPLELIISKLEKQYLYEKAVAMAVFHLDIKKAMVVLNNVSNLSKSALSPSLSKDREFNLKVLSIALAGFGDSGNTNPIWRETCKSTAKSFSDPYLKTCLEFLSTSDSKEIYNVIEDSSINLADKIALACRYLDHQDLSTFIDKNTLAVTEMGNLQGVLLTGLTEKGIDLLQNYIDRTADIQTACLAISVVVPKIFRDKRVSKWHSIYSDLLDHWSLWHERATLDIQRAANKAEPTQPQIFAKCGYCQNSFSFEAVTAASMVGGRSQARPNFKSKVPCCPSCKQSLPRCCLCLLPLNCMVPAVDYKKPTDRESWKAGAEPFEDWFTWCQTCRHGGHAQHILDWFQEHSVCPVTDCTCRCSSL